MSRTIGLSSPKPIQWRLKFKYFIFAPFSHCEIEGAAPLHFKIPANTYKISV